MRRRITDAWARLGTLTPAAGLAAIKRAGGAGPSASDNAGQPAKPSSNKNKALVAGAGVLAVVLPVTICYSGSPFAVAIVGVLAYRILALLLPLPLSLAALPTLRSMGEHLEPTPDGTARSPAEPGVRRGA